MCIYSICVFILCHKRCFCFKLKSKCSFECAEYKLTFQPVISSLFPPSPIRSREWQEEEEEDLRQLLEEFKDNDCKCNVKLKCVNMGVNITVFFALFPLF